MLSPLKTFLPRLALAVVGNARGGITEGSTAATPASATTGVRESKTGSQVVGHAHGKYYEAASRGGLYSISATSQTMTTALSTTGPVTLYNPVGSGKNLAIKKVSFGQVGAANTLGTGTLSHCVYTIKGPVASQSGTVPTGTAISPQNMLIGTANNSVATALSAVTFSAAPVVLYPFANQSQVAAGTIGDNSQVNGEDVNGAIVLAPGSGYAIQSISSTGSTGLANFGIVWEEINQS